MKSRCKIDYRDYLCRRGESRSQIDSGQITYWTDETRPSQVTPIEFDEKGARLLLPWDTEPGDFLRIAVRDELGQYNTQSAIVVWASPLSASRKVVAGLAFAKEFVAA